MTETAKEAARRLSASMIEKGYEPKALHCYTARDGTPIYWRIRLKHPGTGEKWVRPMYANGEGYKFGEPDFAGRLKPIYRLHEIVADPARPVWWVEGEQKADRLAGLGLLATTAGSATSDDGCDFEPLRGRRVILWPDNDDPGRQHAERVAAKLRTINCTVEIIDLKPLALAEHGDVIDYLEAHQSATAADLEALLRLSAGAAVSPDDWPEPAALPSELPAVDAFDLDLLPAALRPWIADIADRVQCPPDFPAVAAMIALGSVLGRKVCIRPKRHDDWYEAANLWGVIVGRPGVLKSPALNEALRPSRSLEGAASLAHLEEVREWRMQQATREIERKAASAKAFAAAKKGESFDSAALIESESEEPALRRYIVNDTSVEALGEVLMHNGNGVLAYRDELIGLLRQLDKEGNEGARSFFLTAWGGKEPYTFDRIGRGLNRRIEHACLSLLGSIQPAVIGEYLREAVTHGGGDGLMARFSLLTWPDVSGEWRNVDRWPDSEASTAAFATFKRFDDLKPDQLGAQLDILGGIYSLRFDPHAQDCFDDWREGFEKKQRNAEADGTHPALIAHREKYRKLIPAVALICHLADKPDGGPVTAEALRRALRWADYADSHAWRAYASVIRADADAARELLRRIRRGEIGDGFRLREVYRNGWTRLADTEHAKKAADLLCDFDYLRSEQDKTAGRWTERYRVHPRLLAEAAEYLKKAAGGY